MPAFTARSFMVLWTSGGTLRIWMCTICGV